MFVVDLEKLSTEQRAMVALWEEHLKTEFQDKDARASCDTMVAAALCKSCASSDRRSGTPTTGAFLRQVLYP